MRIPANTYRLQLQKDFTFDDAAQVLPYLKRLGVDWIYLSPILKAEPGSNHGYDVVDHTKVDDERGGREAFARLAERAHEMGFGVLVDIVPNHVGVATPHINGWWWDVLTHGQASQYASFFDVDWAAGGGKLVIPVLGDESGEGLEVVGDQLHYYENRYPIAPGTTEGLDAEASDYALSVHERQNYRLVHWKLADTDLNYRRFFAVNTLAAIRVEDTTVFNASHVEIESWFQEGLADGLRIDHPDGLYDPSGYLEGLSALTGDAYLLVEKITEPGEQLPTEWRTAGTTGYDMLATIDRLFVDPAGEQALDAIDAELRAQTEMGEAPTWADLIHDTKRGIATGILGSETLRLARELGQANDDNTIDALSEILASFPVYRSYLPEGSSAPLMVAAGDAAARRPELEPTISALVKRLADPSEPAARRLQQTSGMVMAKGVEDTAFYRYTRLTSLTEVGADPSIFATDTAEFHRVQAERVGRWERAMTTLSTHDTKRGEDVRARISTIAEIPGEWAEALRGIRATPNGSTGDGPFDNLLWQAIVGAWPLSRERAHAYVEKASREAGNSTTWTAPDEAFEERMHAAVDAAFDDETVTELVTSFVARVNDAGRSNALAAKLVQVTSVGVPDVYQGTELWEDSLVDPDNRRLIDYDAHVATLDRLDALEPGTVPAVDDDGLAKLLVTQRALTLTRDRADLFTGYAPVTVSGPAAAHLVAFDRGGAITLATRLPIGLAARGGWEGTTVALPEGRWRDALSGRPIGSGEVTAAEILTALPVALLVRDEGDSGAGAGADASAGNARAAASEPAGFEHGADGSVEADVEHAPDHTPTDTFAQPDAEGTS